MKRPGLVGAAVSAAAVVLYLTAQCRSGGLPVKVGILHSTTGTMAISESPVVAATRLAIDEVNRAGGVLGRQVEPVVVDGASDLSTFERSAERLITRDQVVTVFGCWTSASRKTVKPVFEKYGHLLIYPVQYEGLETSPNIVYTGAAPNQQIIPAVKWAFDNLGRRFFLVGSDYVFPRTANEIIKDQIRALGGEVVGEEYVLLGGTDVAPVVDRIRSTSPKVILNTINGDTNLAFFKALRAAGIDSRTIPSVSFSIAEPELKALGAELLAGDYASWNYFQSIATPENEAFVRALKTTYGAEQVVSDPMEAAYLGVKMWAQAVEDAGRAEVTPIREAMGRQSLSAPEGIVYIDPETQHTWKVVRIGRALPSGQFDVVWSSEKPIRPSPYPAYRTRAEWTSFLTDLRARWGAWANPGPKAPPAEGKP